MNSSEKISLALALGVLPQTSSSATLTIWNPRAVPRAVIEWVMFPWGEFLSHITLVGEPPRELLEALAVYQRILPKGITRITEEVFLAGQHTPGEWEKHYILATRPLPGYIPLGDSLPLSSQGELSLAFRGDSLPLPSHWGVNLSEEDYMRYFKPLKRSLLGTPEPDSIPGGREHKLGILGVNKGVLLELPGRAPLEVFLELTENSLDAIKRLGVPLDYNTLELRGRYFLKGHRLNSKHSWVEIDVYSSG